jgi:enoyl-[acyl-carrier protein] reductase I
MDFLELSGKKVLVFGVANRKSVAYHIAQVLHDAGCEVLFSVRSPERKKSVEKLLAGSEVYVCDVEKPEEITRLKEEILAKHPQLDGIVHSIAFAEYEGGVKPFHETGKREFLRAVDISCYSLIAIANEFRSVLSKTASVVTISISTTKMASESYGYMAPIKAALESSLAFLAKSFSRFSEVRFNAVAPGLLKTSASAGIPGYVDSYLFAEQVIPRRRAIDAAEVASTAAFLLSPRSSGINAQCVVIDAGMAINYFDADIVRKVSRGS